MRTNSTNKAAFERMERVSRILAKRYRGQSLADIGAAEGVTPQAIHSLIQRALGQMPQQATTEIRLLEANRLDAMQSALWPQCLLGDHTAIDRVLAIMKRRAAMLGLDLQTGYYSREDGDGGDRVVKVEILGNPQIDRVRWLEERSERLRELEGSAPPTTGTLQ